MEESKSKSITMDTLKASIINVINAINAIILEFVKKDLQAIHITILMKT